MVLLLKNFDALVILLFGVTAAIVAVEVYVKHKTILEMVLWLSFGAAFTAVGLLVLTGVIPAEMAGVSSSAVVGIALTWMSIVALYSPPSPSFPVWTKWAMLVFGVVSILTAVVQALNHYWR